MTSGSKEEPRIREGFFGRTQFGVNPGLLVVDMSLGFTDPASPLACELEEVVGAISRLLDAARRIAAPVVFTTVSYSKAYETTAAAFLAKVPALRALEAGTRWVEIDPRIEPLAEEPILTKLFASAFFGTPLASILSAARVDTLIVAGASTSGCVRASVVDALQHGFQPVVAPEAVGDRDRGAHEANLYDMDAKYANIVPLEEVIDYLGSSRAQDPR